MVALVKVLPIPITTNNFDIQSHENWDQNSTTRNIIFYFSQKFTLEKRKQFLLTLVATIFCSRWCSCICGDSLLRYKHDDTNSILSCQVLASNLGRNLQTNQIPQIPLLCEQIFCGVPCATTWICFKYILILRSFSCVVSGFSKN